MGLNWEAFGKGIGGAGEIVSGGLQRKWELEYQDKIAEKRLMREQELEQKQWEVRNAKEVQDTIAMAEKNLELNKILDTFRTLNETEKAKNMEVYKANLTAYANSPEVMEYVEGAKQSGDPLMLASAVGITDLFTKAMGGDVVDTGALQKHPAWGVLPPTAQSNLAAIVQDHEQKERQLAETDARIEYYKSQAQWFDVARQGYVSSGLANSMQNDIAKIEDEKGKLLSTPAYASARQMLSKTGIQGVNMDEPWTIPDEILTKLPPTIKFAIDQVLPQLRMLEANKAMKIATFEKAVAGDTKLQKVYDPYAKDIFPPDSPTIQRGGPPTANEPPAMVTQPPARREVVATGQEEMKKMGRSATAQRQANARLANTASAAGIPSNMRIEEVYNNDDAIRLYKKAKPGMYFYSELVGGRGKGRGLFVFTNEKDKFGYYKPHLVMEIKD